MKSFWKLTLATLGCLFLYPTIVKADCTNPDVKEAVLIYNHDCKVMQYCDGTNWVLVGHKMPNCDRAPVWQTAAGTVATIETGAALSVVVTATDDSGSVTYSKVSGDAWISVNAGSGELTGTAPGSTGTYSVTVRATDGSGKESDRIFDVVVSVAPDNTPDAFSFTDQTDVAVSTQIQSNIIQITGMDNGTAVSIAGDGSPQYRICADGTCSAAPAYTGSAGTIDAGEYVQVRLTSSASNSTTLSATLTIGTGSDQWDVTTVASSGPTGCTNPGDQCDAPNDFYYAGLSPDGDVPFYVTSQAHEVQRRWNNNTSNWLDTPLTNCTSGGTQDTCKTGKANTEALAAGDDNLHYDSATTNGSCAGLAAAGDACQSIHEAADYCADLVAHGKDDWYLPSLAELDVLYVNLVAPSDPDNPTWQDGAGGGSTDPAVRDGPLAGSFQTGYYWSASEYSNIYAWVENFSDGSQYHSNKGNNYYVRCVRR